MVDIFISYAREDRSRVEPILKALEDAGFSVWRAEFIPPASNWISVMDGVIKAAKCSLVLWSEESIQSDLVQAEADIAMENSTLIHAILDQVEPPINFKMLQPADLTDWVPGSSHHEFDKLLGAISALVGKIPPAFERAAPSPKKIDDAFPGREGKTKRKGKGLVGAGTAMVQGAVACLTAIPKIFKLRGHEVYLGASAPSFTRPEDEFTARFVAYVSDAEKEIEEKLQKLSLTATPHLGIKRCQWKPNTEVSVSLFGRGLKVDEAVQSFIWNPPHVIVDFDVQVLPAASYGTTILKFDVCIEEIRVAKLRIDLQITDSVESEQRNTAIARPSQTAFASYSSKDEKRVTDRLASVEISAGIDVFYARKSMKPGDEWKSRIPKEILERDQFLLFWSRAAAASKWVKWEWQYALNEKGKKDMQIHPLQLDVPPPDELSDLHFNDIYMAIWERED